jgi:hypothetical protein
MLSLFTYINTGLAGFTASAVTKIEKAPDPQIRGLMWPLTRRLVLFPLAVSWPLAQVVLQHGAFPRTVGTSHQMPAHLCGPGLGQPAQMIIPQVFRGGTRHPKQLRLQSVLRAFQAFSFLVTMRTLLQVPGHLAISLTVQKHRYPDLIQLRWRYASHDH